MRPSSEVLVFPDASALFEAAAFRVAEEIRRAVAKGSCRIALAGGATPRELYLRLALVALPWDRVDFFWGDERIVPRDHPGSNARMARESLLSRVPIPPERIHPVPVDAADPAAAYEAELRSVFALQEGAWPRFDLVLLGLGSDAHTASLFPDSPALKETRRLAVAAQAPMAPVPRVTLTLPVLNQARLAVFLVSGSGKAEALRNALGNPDARHPASLTHPSASLWMVDAEAARELPRFLGHAEPLAIQGPPDADR